MLDDNELYCPEYILHTINNFLAMCFFWASLGLNGTIVYSSRWTNGCIEKAFATKKRINSAFRNQLPSAYANYHLPITKGEVVEFHNKQSKAVSNKRKDFPEIDEDEQLETESWGPHTHPSNDRLVINNRKNQ